MSNWTDLYEATVLESSLIVFGEETTYTPLAESPYSLRGIFNEIFAEVDGAGAIVQSRRPNLGIRLSDMQDVPGSGDLVEVRGVTYRVVEKEEDGEGGATLFLHVDS